MSNRISMNGTTKRREDGDKMPWTLKIHAKDKAGYNELLEYMRQVGTYDFTDEDRVNSVRVTYDHLTEEEAQDKLLLELSRQFPNSGLLCFEYDSNEYDISFTPVARLTTLDGDDVSWRAVDPGVNAMICDTMLIYENDNLLTTESILSDPVASLSHLLELAREGDWNAQWAAISCLFYAQWYEVELFAQLLPEDKKWLMKMAESKEDYRSMALLLKGMHCSIRSYVEEFEDVNTGEMEPITRYETIYEEPLFEHANYEPQRLYDMLCVEWYYHDEEQMLKACKIIREYTEFDYTPLLFRLADNWHNKKAAAMLYQLYLYGEESLGIFIDRKKAKEYYEMADDAVDDEWDDIEDPGEDNPMTFEYVLTGNATTLDGVEKLIRDLCQRFGIPENDKDGLGLYVPQRMLIKVLVGSDSEYYRGNILHLERTAPDRLVITAESNNGYPLLFALRQSFENIECIMDN